MLTQRPTMASIDALGYSVVCLLPEKRSSSLLTMMRGPAFCVTSISAIAGVVHARGGEAGDVDGLAALQSLADRRDFLSRERAVDPMEADARHRRLAEPARKAIARPGEAGMPRPDPHCWRFQA